MNGWNSKSISRYTMSKNSISSELRSEFKAICNDAIANFETNYFDKAIFDQLRRTIRRKAKECKIGVWDKLIGGGHERIQAIIQEIEWEIEELLQAHIKKCHKIYRNSINKKCTALLERKIAETGREIPTTYKEDILVGMKLKTVKLPGLEFTAGITGFFDQILTALTVSETTIQNAIADKIIKQVAADGPKGKLATIWKKTIEPQLRKHFDQIWSGTKDGNGIEDLAEAFMQKRQTRSFSAQVPKWLRAELGDEHKTLFNQLKSYWMQIPRVDENAFVIAVAGPTSAGKSTLLNRLLGYAVIEECFAQHTTPCPILLTSATSALPTCRIDAYRHGLKSPFITDEISLQRASTNQDDAMDVVSTNRLFLDARDSFWSPVHACRKLQRLEFLLPSPLLADGLTLADLPGVEGYFEGNEHRHATELKDLSRIWLARADAAIFVFAPEQVRRANVSRFVGEFAKTKRPMAVFISMCDKLSPLELGCEGAEATRAYLAGKLVLPFMVDNGVNQLNERNLFLGAARLQDDAWAKRETARQLQELALADTQRLSRWITYQHAQHKDENRKARQAAADQETAHQIDHMFSEYIASMTSAPIPESIDLFGKITPDLPGLRKRTLHKLIKTRNRLLASEFSISC